MENGNPVGCGMREGLGAFATPFGSFSSLSPAVGCDGRTMLRLGCGGQMSNLFVGLIPCVRADGVGELDGDGS